MGLQAKWEGNKKYFVILPKPTESAALSTKSINVISQSQKESAKKCRSYPQSLKQLMQHSVISPGQAKPNQRDLRSLVIVSFNLANALPDKSELKIAYQVVVTTCIWRKYGIQNSSCLITQAPGYQLLGDTYPAGCNTGRGEQYCNYFNLSLQKHVQAKL